MNSKAQKSQIQFPPLLNLCKDRPHVDSTLKNWEKVNAPYLNDMISPVYIKNNGESGVYDKQGHKHTIDSKGNWLKDGTVLTTGNTHHFERTEIANSSNWLAAEFIEKKLVHAVEGVDYASNPTVDIYQDDTLLCKQSLQANAEIQDVRLFNIKETSFAVGLLTVVYSINKVSYLTASYIIKYNNRYNTAEKIKNLAITFRRQVVGDPPTYAVISTPEVKDVLVSAAEISSYYSSPAYHDVMITVLNQYGAALNTRYNGFATYIITDSTSNPYYEYDGTNVKSNYQSISTTNKWSWSDVWRLNKHSTRTAASLTDYFQYGIDVYKNNLGYIQLTPEQARAIAPTPGYAAENTVWYPIRSLTSAEEWNNLTVTTGLNGVVDFSDWFSSLPLTATKSYTLTDPVLAGYADGGATTAKTVSGEIAIALTTSVYQITTNYTANWVEGTSSSNYGEMSTVKAVVTIGMEQESRDAGITSSLPSQVTYNNYNTFTIDYIDEDDGFVPDNLTWSITYYQEGTSDTGAVAYVNWTLNGTGGDETTVYGNSNQYNLEYSGVSPVQTNVDASMVPNVILDNGKMYSLAGFKQNTTSYSTLNINKALVLSGSNINFDRSTGVISYDVVESVPITTSGWSFRSNSIIYNQGLFAQTAKLSYSAITPAAAASSGTESTSARFLEFYNSSTTDLKYMPGTSRYTGFNYYSDYIIKGSTTGGAEDRLVYNTIGSRVSNGAGYTILYNTTTDNSCYIQGISWTNSNDYIGTLLTPWQDIAENFYIAIYNNKVCYKNKAGNVVVIERVEEVSTITAILRNRFLILNTDQYWNMYDSNDGKLYHYASDWNFRCLGGTSTFTSMTAYTGSVYSFNFRNIAASQNQVIARTSSRTNYSNPNVYPVASWQTPVYSKARILIDDITLYGADEPNGGNNLGIDVYYTRAANTSSSGVGDAYYQYTYLNGTRSFNTLLGNTTYVISTATSAFLNPSLLARYLDGAGNNDLVFDLNEGYTLNYYNNEPTLIYPVSSEINNATAFFVIQGQFYAIINDKICSVSYSDGALSSKDPIIDITGMKFIGNNPMIAFFWSERYRAFYSFTGDAVLEHIYNGNKFTGISGDYYYDESTQTIYVPTSEGLLCFGPKNTYLFEEYKNVTLVQFTDDGVTRIQDNNTDYGLVYYQEDDYTVKPLDLETSFWGIGATENTTIDRWQATLYDLEGNHPTGDVIVGVRSLTDITVKSEEKKIHIAPEDWDKWSNSVLITYNPKLIKGQGLRLYLKSPFIVQQLTAHVMDSGSGTLTKNRSMV